MLLQWHKLNQKDEEACFSRFLLHVNARECFTIRYIFFIKNG